MKRESRTVGRSHQPESSQRHLPLVDLLVDTRAALFELAISSGLRVLTTMLEDDRTALCGTRYQHQSERMASRAGTVPSEVVLGGRKVAIRRPRVRADGREVVLPTFRTMADADPLNRRVVEQMLVGVATRHYARSLEPLPPTVTSRGISKSAVSRRFVAKTRAQLEAWQSTSLEGLDLVGLLLDGVHVGEHCLIVALGIAADGEKHALGLWEGSTENATLCQSLLANLQSRGLRTDRSLLVILDGSKALRKAVRDTFGDRGPGPALPGAQTPQRARPSAGAAAPLGEGQPPAGLSQHGGRGPPGACSSIWSGAWRPITRALRRACARASTKH